MEETSGAESRCESILSLLLAFTERNPGITRILTGDALTGENEKLHSRVTQFFDRLETQLKQVLREAEMREGLRPTVTINTAANLLLSVADGRINQYVRSNFKRKPTEYWEDQWPLIMQGFFKQTGR
jgi:TetR/AcrR family transcriptional regulator